jgi:hypothetical protein
MFKALSKKRKQTTKMEVIIIGQEIEDVNMQEDYCKEEDKSEECCDECQDALEASSIDEYCQEIYHRPDDEEGSIVRFCSDACRESYLWHPEFPYLECFHCHRFVCYRLPTNGYHTQFRDHPFEDKTSGVFTEVCEACYSSLVANKGQELDDFLNNQGEPRTQIRGGVWFDEKEFQDYMCDPDFDRYKVSCGREAMLFNARAGDHIKAGRRVVTCLDSMAIGGLEGRISLFHAMPKGNNEEDVNEEDVNEEDPREQDEGGGGGEVRERDVERDVEKEGAPKKRRTKE